MMMNKFETPKIEIIMFKAPEVIGTNYTSNTGNNPLGDEADSEDEMIF